MTRTRSLRSGYLQQILIKNFETNTAQGDEGCIIHDASAVIAHLFPECFTYRKATVDVVTDKAHNGETLALPGETHIITEKADRARVMDILRRAAV